MDLDGNTWSERTISRMLSRDEWIRFILILFLFFMPLFRLHALVALPIRTADKAFYAVLPLVASNKASAGDLLRQATAFRLGGESRVDHDDFLHVDLCPFNFRWNGTNCCRFPLFSLAGAFCKTKKPSRNLQERFGKPINLAATCRSVSEN